MYYFPIVMFQESLNEATVIDIHTIELYRGRYDDHVMKIINAYVGSVQFRD